MLLILLVTGCAVGVPPASTPAKSSSPQLLLFTHTTGFRHKSIPQGIAAIAQLAAAKGYAVTATEDPAIFSASRLSAFRVVVFLSNVTNPNDPASDYLAGSGIAALRDWSLAGGATVAIHGATDSHFHSEFYPDLVGALFKRHPRGTHDAPLRIVAPGHPAVRGLPSAFARHDEWYEMRAPPRAAQILVTVDPAAFGEPGAPWPVSWTTHTGRGRNFVTVMGHTEDSFRERLFLDHIAAGLDWAVAASAGQR